MYVGILEDRTNDRILNDLLNFIMEVVDIKRRKENKRREKKRKKKEKKMKVKKATRRY